MMVAISVILFFLDWKLALMSLAFMPFLLLVTIRFSLRLKPILKDVQQKIADVTAAAEENVVGSRIVRIFAREDDELVKFSDRSYKVFEASVAAARVRAKYIPLIAFIPNLAVAFLLYYGGRQVIEGNLSLGSLVAFYSYLMMLVYPAQIIGWLTGLAQRAIASGERVYEVLDSPLEMTEKPDAQPLRDAFGLTASEFVAAGAVEAAGPTGSVTFDDVWFSYVDRPVLRGVSLEVPAGRTIALVGHTGCGKTTLTNLVPRFYDTGGGARAASTARTSATCSWPTCAGTSASSTRTRSSSAPPSPRTSASAGRRRATTRSGRRRGPRRPTTSSRRSPRATRRSSASAASRSAAASASASPSRGRSSWTRASSSSTTPPAASTWRPSSASGPRCRR